jgi:hypothetical protein
MALVGIIVETPALVRVGMPIYTLAEYEINRELNAVSSWSLAFPCSEALSAVIKSRYRISIVEEGRSGYLLRRGIVSARTFRVSGDASGVLALQGFSRLWKTNGQSTHKGLSYDGVTKNIKQIAEELLDETVSAPADYASRKPKVDFNDTSRLSSLLGACEYVRYNVRESWDEEIDLVMVDDVPDSGYKFVLARQAGTDRRTAAARGYGLLSGNPVIGHDGVTMATRIIPVGTDFDGSQLTLETATETVPFPVQMGTNPDGSNFWYLEIDSPEEVIEEHFVRSDVKNPNDDPTSRTEAANVLYALAASRLLLSQKETLSFSGEIANGNQIDALPGSRVEVIFEGQARTPWKTVTWESLDRHMLITKRRDVGFAGTRRVAFTLTCPESSLAIPSLPEAVPIPPPEDSPDPPYMDPDDPMGDDGSDAGGDESGNPIPEIPRDLPPSTALENLIEDIRRGRGKLQPCCADTTTGIGGGAIPPPL